MRTAGWSPLILLYAGALSGCESPQATTPRTPTTVTTVHGGRRIMSTQVSITVAVPEPGAEPGAPAESAIEAALVEMERVELLLSEWKPGSQISKVNAAAGKAPISIGEELFEVLELAHRISAQSGGAFDVTVGALWGAWDFKWEKPRIPAPKDLAARVARIDHTRLVLNPEARKRTAFLQDPGMKIALGGIAKGYGVDRASAVLTARGFPNHLVVAGGDLFAAGTKGAKPWRIGIRDPSGPGIFGTLEIKNEGVATSGNYEKFFVKNGVRYHHLLVPRTGQPARGLASATVRAPTAALADAWATAIFVAGAQEGLRLAQERPDLEAFLFAEDTFERTGTPGLMKRVLPLPKDAAVHGPTLGLEPH